MLFFQFLRKSYVQEKDYTKNLNTEVEMDSSRNIFIPLVQRFSTLASH